MTQVNIHQAKTHLSRLIAAAEKGEEVVIARDGKPAVRIVPLGGKPKRQIRIGIAKGRFKLPDDFDADNDYIAALFNGDIDD